VVATGAWSTAATTAACFCFANNQNECQQSTKHKHHLANHFEFLARPRKILQMQGGSETAKTTPATLPPVRIGVYADIPGGSNASQVSD